MLCPCWFGIKELMVMDKGYCAGPILFRVQSGTSNGADLKGRDVVLGFDFPGPTVLDGNATSRLYIDDKADPRQHEQLEEIFQGKKGGPMAMIAQLSSKWLPTQKTQIAVSDDGNNLTATIGNFGQIRSRQLKNEKGRSMIVQGAGFASAFQMEDETFTLAPSGTEWSDMEMPHPQITTKSGAVARFSWEG
jgi:hypothetical protein